MKEIRNANTVFYIKPQEMRISEFLTGSDKKNVKVGVLDKTSAVQCKVPFRIVV